MKHKPYNRRESIMSNQPSTSKNTTYNQHPRNERYFNTKHKSWETYDEEPNWKKGKFSSEQNYSHRKSTNYGGKPRGKKGGTESILNYYNRYCWEREYGRRRTRSYDDQYEQSEYRSASSTRRNSSFSSQRNSNFNRSHNNFEIGADEWISTSVASNEEHLPFSEEGREKTTSISKHAENNAGEKNYLSVSDHKKANSKKRFNIESESPSENVLSAQNQTASTSERDSILKTATITEIVKSREQPEGNPAENSTFIDRMNVDETTNQIGNNDVKQEIKQELLNAANDSEGKTKRIEEMNIKISNVKTLFQQNGIDSNSEITEAQNETCLNNEESNLITNNELEFRSDGYENQVIANNEMYSNDNSENLSNQVLINNDLINDEMLLNNELMNEGVLNNGSIDNQTTLNNENCSVSEGSINTNQFSNDGSSITNEQQVHNNPQEKRINVKKLSKLIQPEKQTLIDDQSEREVENNQHIVKQEINTVQICGNIKQEKDSVVEIVDNDFECVEEISSDSSEHLVGDKDEIYVTNLCKSTTVLLLCMLFQKYGHVLDIKFINTKGVKSAIVKFERSESAKKALIENGQIWNGRHLIVNLYGVKWGNEPHTINIYNITPDVDREDLWKTFDCCGKIVRTFIHKKNKFEELKGSVVFQSAKAVSVALKMRLFLHGRLLTIKKKICTVDADSVSNGNKHKKKLSESSKSSSRKRQNSYN